MIQKLVIIGTLAATCLLFPIGPMASAENKSALQSGAGEEKFRKLQKEMENDASNLPAIPSSNSTTDGANKANKTPEVRSLPSLVFQVLTGLIFVLILAVVTIRVLKRLQGRMLAKPGKTGGEFFEVLETCHLGAHQRVVALRMNDEVGILGVTPQGISLINVLKEPASEVRQAYARESNSALFSENLNKLMERFKKPKKVSDMLNEAQR